MEKNEEVELEILKKEMGEVGEKNMNSEKKARYIILRHKQKAERRNDQETILKETKKPLLNKFNILLAILPLIFIIIIIFIIINMAPDDNKNGCVIGQDSPDCLEGAGSGHPLWND